MKLIMLGPPGVGKGTQAQKLLKDYDLVQISTGDILREAVKNKTELGKKAKEFMDAGKLVTDSIMLGLVEETLFSADGPKEYILDGFPRTVPQAEGLSKMFEKHNESVDTILVYDADADQIVSRLSARRTCKNCKQVYNLISMPPKKENTCDLCGGELYQRDDDKEETIQNRLKIYAEQTAPLIDYYKDSGKLRAVIADGTPEEVYEKTTEVLGS